MTNIDERMSGFKRRLLEMAKERQRIAVDEREIGLEMRDQKLTATEQKGIKLAVKRDLEEPERRAERLLVEEIADSLGDFRDTPLGRATINAATVQHTGVNQ